MLDWSKELESAKRDLEYLVESEKEKEFSTKHLFVFSKLESTKPKTPEKRERVLEETTPVPRGNSRIKPTEPVNLSDVFDVPLQVEDLKKETPVPGKKNAKTRPPLAPVGSLSLPEKEHVMMDIPEDYEYASSNRDQENVEMFEFKPPILFAEERKRWHNSLRSYRGKNSGTRPLWGKGSSTIRSKKKQQQTKRRRLNKTPPYLNSLKDIKPRRGNRPADFVGWAAHDRRRYEAPSASFGAQNLIVTQDQDVPSKLFLRVKTNVENNQHQHKSTVKQDDEIEEKDEEDEEKDEEEVKESIPDISMPPGLRSPRRRSISRDDYAAEISIPESIVLPDEDAKNLLVQVDGTHDEKHHRGATSPKRGRRSPRRRSISRDAFVTNESRSIHLSSEPTKEVALDTIHNRDDGGDERKMKTVARRRSVSEKAVKPSKKSPQKHISESPSKGQGLSAAVPDDTQHPSIPGRAVVSRLCHEFASAQADEKKHHRPSLHVPSRVVPEKRHPVKSDVEDVEKPSSLAEVTKLLRMSRDRKLEKEKNRKIEEEKIEEEKIEEEKIEKMKNTQDQKKKKTSITKKNIEKSQDKPTRRRADHKDWKSKSSRRRGSYFGTYV